MFTSKRNNDGRVELSDIFEDFLCNLLGAQMKNAHQGSKSDKHWKNKYAEKLFRTIRLAIKRNLNSDGFHQYKINLYIEELERLCKEDEFVEIEMIHCLCAIIFELLGGIPNYYNRTRLTKNSDYILSNCRSLHYTQTPSQKAYTIIKASKYGNYSHFHQNEDFFEIYVTKFNGDPKGFIDWCKKTHPEFYMEVF